MLVLSMDMQEVVVKLPGYLMDEVKGVMAEDQCNFEDLIFKATKCYLEERRERQIREDMRQGYLEMAKINLTIASEAFLVEQEAERLVSGV